MDQKQKTPYPRDLNKDDLWDYLAQTADPATTRKEELVIAAKTIAYAEAAWSIGRLDQRDALDLIIAAEVWL